MKQKLKSPLSTDFSKIKSGFQLENLSGEIWEEIDQNGRYWIATKED